MQLGHFRRCSSVDRQLKPMPVRVEEIDRLENAVIGGPDHIESLRLGARLCGQQRFEVADLEGDVLHPLRRVGIAPHLGLFGQFEEGEHVAPAGVQKDMHVGIVFSG